MFELFRSQPLTMFPIGVDIDWIGDASLSSLSSSMMIVMITMQLIYKVLMADHQ